jgi:hypothetical protein|tara:strand:+ start:857 stop:1144 length:288 start_codon:yes stop_codon:yes gene_type:complete
MNKKYKCYYCGTVEIVRVSDFENYAGWEMGPEPEDWVPIRVGDLLCGNKQCGAPVGEGMAELMQKKWDRIIEEVESGKRHDSDHTYNHSYKEDLE